MRTALITTLLIGIAIVGILVEPVIAESPPAGPRRLSLEQLKLAYRRPAAIPSPADNPYTKEGQALGEMLFFDPRLSSSSDIACATCHDPRTSWGDGRPRAIGFGGAILARRTPTILNLAWTELLFWDGHADSLEAQAVLPMQSPHEMNQSLERTVARLQRIEGYRSLFEAAYPGQGITAQTIVKAITTFERTVVSGPAPFDAWIAGAADAISPAAARGFVLFNGRANCAVCHSGWNFSDGAFYDIGLPSTDRGRGALLPLLVMQYAFKTPTLRDVDRRGPYMHDGSVATLAEAIELYDRGGEARPSRSREIRPLGLTAGEKADLLAFLKTLTGASTARPRPELPR